MAKMSPEPARRLLIVGASTRAAAWSAWRAGFQPVCADQFADRDLHQVAEVVPVKHYPSSLPEDLARVSTDAWMFVGAMENHRRILRQLHEEARFGRYGGPPLQAIMNLRDPLWLAGRLQDLGCFPPSTMAAPCTVPRENSSDVRWLRKPFAGGGGRMISFAAPEKSQEEPCYWQQFIPGTPFSALYLVANGRPNLLMLSRQLIGLSESAAPTPFAYCGSLGPWSASPAMDQQLTKIGAVIVSRLDYAGLLGVDLIWDGRRFWVIEVNPRYTASSELWELAFRRSAVGEHLAACGFTGMDHSFSQTPNSSGSSRRLLGKLILYADRDLIAPDLERFLAVRSPWSMPFLADIPPANSAIPAGSPICTVFASGRTAEDCFLKLRRRAGRVRRWFGAGEISRGIFDNS